MPELKRYFEENQRGKKVLLIGVSIQEKAEIVEKFKRKQDLTFPIAVDSSGAVGRRYGIRSFPTTVLIGADGKIKLYQIGAISDAEKTFGRQVDESLKKIAHSSGITPTTYLRKTSMNASLSLQKQLEGRGRAIAETMTCPCGCGDKVLPCHCGTASEIKKKLRVMAFNQKSDREIIQDLKREFSRSN
jgi:hypothetical protein